MRIALPKTLSIEDRLVIKSCETPGLAKKLSKSLTLRENWDNYKLIVMANILSQKFDLNGSNEQKVLAQKLIDTGDAELIEGNYWGDVFWSKIFNLHVVSPLELARRIQDIFFNQPNLNYKYICV
jgi:predicted NAD-dependent protein-ADP-ribosyltransferase YbiA (DUF1768 family)